MEDWGDETNSGPTTFTNASNDFKSEEPEGRSLGKGRGFAPARVEEDTGNGWNSNNDRSDFGDRRGRGGGRGRGGRGGGRGGFNNDDDSFGGRSFNSEGRRERGGFSGRGRRNFDDNNEGGGGGWGNSNNDGDSYGSGRNDDDRRGRGGGRGRRNFDDNNEGGGGGWGSSNNDGDSYGSGRNDDNRRGRGGSRGRRNFDDNNEGGGWESSNNDGDNFGSGRRGGGRRDFNNDNDNDDNAGDGDAPKVEPVTYIPKELSEDDLFTDTGIAKGINFDDYEDIQVNVTGENKPQPIKSFEDAQFRQLVLDNLRKCKYDKPTPIQKYSIPIVMEGRDLMATAQTGSGKTAAFLLPIINNLLSEKIESDTDDIKCYPNALILSPTRELAIQIKDNARLYTSQSYLKVGILYGGVAVRHQSMSIMRGVNILIATPGRLADFVKRGWVLFDKIRFVVLDEADRMLDMGFVGEIENIMNHETMAPRDHRQTLMFSATFSEDIQRLAGKFLRKDYIFVAVGIVGGACKDVEQNFIVAQSNEKRTHLIKLLEEQGNVDGTLLFVDTKRIADFLASFLSERGFRTTSIHGDRQQFQREEALRDFKSRKMSILVATNVAARGLDISGVKHVINYDLPKEIDEYVHRIGRTGRLGNKGKATSFYDSSRDQAVASNLVRILKQANQKVPDFLQQDATGMGDYESDAFGARDYRKQDDDEGFKTDPRNIPQTIQEDEGWD